MLKLFVSQSLVEVETRKEVLEQEGILCTVKNQQGSSLAGEVPFAEVFPELWVINDDDFPRAQEFLENWSKAAATIDTAWSCSGCGEHHTGEFTTCWKCGKEKNSKSGLRPWNRDVSPDADEKKFTSGEMLIVLFLGVFITWSGLAAWDYYSLKSYPTDRNKDGKEDLVETFRDGFLVEQRLDNDFNGIFETVYQFNRKGLVTKGEVDRNQDGIPDLIGDYIFGILKSDDFLDTETGKVKKRAFFRLGVKVREEIDVNGDGTFDKTTHFDEYEDPINPSLNP